MRKYYANITMVVGKVGIKRWKDAYNRSCEREECELTYVHKHKKPTKL